MKRWVAGCLVFVCGSAWAVKNPCSLILESQFKESSFKALQDPDGVSPDFADWAAKTASEVMSLIREGNIAVAFEFVAAAREQFQLEHFWNPIGYGKLKSRFTPEHQVVIGRVDMDSDVALPKGGPFRFVKQALRLYGNITKDAPSITVPLTYTDLNNTQKPLKRIELEREEIYGVENRAVKVVAVGGVDALKAFTVARVRINKALQSKSRVEKRKQFILASYLFFSAMPYVKGSGSIGRVIFTALAQELFGKQITLDANIDVQALIRSEPSYYSWLDEKLK